MSDKVVCERWSVTVCERWSVTVCERWCVTKMVCERWCGERWCVKDGVRVRDGVVKDGVRQSCV